MPSVHRCRFAILLVYRRWLSGLRVLLPFCNLSLVPFGSWYFLLTVAASRSSSTLAPERLIGIFWTTRRNFSRLLTLYSQLQCTALTFVSYIGDCDHPVARACRGKKKRKHFVSYQVGGNGESFSVVSVGSLMIVQVLLCRFLLQHDLQFWRPTRVPPVISNKTNNEDLVRHFLLWQNQKKLACRKPKDSCCRISAVALAVLSLRVLHVWQFSGSVFKVSVEISSKGNFKSRALQQTQEADIIVVEEAQQTPDVKTTLSLSHVDARSLLLLVGDEQQAPGGIEDDPDLKLLRGPLLSAPIGLLTLPMYSTTHFLFTYMMHNMPHRHLPSIHLQELPWRFYTCWGKRMPASTYIKPAQQWKPLWPCGSSQVGRHPTYQCKSSQIYLWTRHCYYISDVMWGSRRRNGG